MCHDQTLELQALIIPKKYEIAMDERRLVQEEHSSRKVNSITGYYKI